MGYVRNVTTDWIKTSQTQIEQFSIECRKTKVIPWLLSNTQLKLLCNEEQKQFDVVMA